MQFYVLSFSSAQSKKAQMGTLKCVSFTGVTAWGLHAFASLFVADMSLGYCLQQYAYSGTFYMFPP